MAVLATKLFALGLACCFVLLATRAEIASVDSLSGKWFNALHPQLQLLVEEHGLDAVVDSLCDNLEKSFINPLRCARGETEESLRKPGVKFLQSNKITKLEPVLLVPGFGGSTLQAKLDKEESPAWNCFKHFKWFKLWAAVNEIFTQNCWFDNMHVYYNQSTSTYYNTPGVSIRPLDFGDLTGIQTIAYFLGLPLPVVDAYGTLIKSLEAVGYEAGKNLRGVPYDFRLPPDDNAITGVYDQLKQLVEDTYHANDDTPVNIITHSFGGPTTLYFLNLQSQEWKDKYVKAFIPIAGPWSGASKALRAAVSGENLGLEVLGISLISLDRVRDFARQAGGLISLIPDPIYYKDNFVFVSTPERNYTASDFKDLFNDVGSPITAAIHQAEENIFNDMKAPNVTTYCMYGYGHPTEIAYSYPNGFDGKVEVDTSNMGDGTVPLESLQECSSWVSEQTATVSVQEYELNSHTEILKNEDLIQEILTITTS